MKPIILTMILITSMLMNAFAYVSEETNCFRTRAGGYQCETRSTDYCYDCFGVLND